MLLFGDTVFVEFIDGVGKLSMKDGVVNFELTNEKIDKDNRAYISAETSKGLPVTARNKFGICFPKNLKPTIGRCLIHNYMDYPFVNVQTKEAVLDMGTLKQLGEAYLVAQNIDEANIVLDCSSAKMKHYSLLFPGIHGWPLSISIAEMPFDEYLHYEGDNGPFHGEYRVGDKALFRVAADSMERLCEDAMHMRYQYAAAALLKDDECLGFMVKGDETILLALDVTGEFRKLEGFKDCKDFFGTAACPFFEVRDGMFVGHTRNTTHTYVYKKDIFPALVDWAENSHGRLFLPPKNISLIQQLKESEADKIL